MTGNTSGFHGYTLANLYPGWGSGVTQYLDTVPEPTEQAAMAQIGDAAPMPVDSRTNINIWLVLGILAGLIVVFGRG